MSNKSIKNLYVIDKEYVNNLFHMIKTYQSEQNNIINNINNIINNPDKDDHTKYQNQLNHINQKLKFYKECLNVYLYYAINRVNDDLQSITNHLLKLKDLPEW